MFSNQRYLCSKQLAYSLLRNVAVFFQMSSFCVVVSLFVEGEGWLRYLVCLPGVT